MYWVKLECNIMGESWFFFFFFFISSVAHVGITTERETSCSSCEVRVKKELSE